MTRVIGVESNCLSSCMLELASHMATVSQAMKELDWYPVHTSQSMATDNGQIYVSTIILYEYRGAE